jgi:hypothetical protein
MRGRERDEPSTALATLCLSLVALVTIDCAAGSPLINAIGQMLK